MIILGIDTSGKTASVALYNSESEIFLSEASVYTRLTHSQVIMPLCADVLARAEKTLQDVDVISSANGPGSYTGLRIGVSSVKAMAFGTDSKACGVSTLESLAYSNTSFRGMICSVMKARENLVYSAVYYSDGISLENVLDEEIISHEELNEFLVSNDMPVLLCGDGCTEFYGKYNSENFSLAPPDSRLQNARGVCLATVTKELLNPEDITVSYLQKVKAEKDLEKSN